MPFQTVVRYCAPTLAGMKMGSLFSVGYNSNEELKEDVAQKNALLNPKGIFFVVLRCSGTVALIYVYRKKQLEAVLADYAVRQFMMRYGYTAFDIPSVLVRMEAHLTQSDFPHEIGVILGYPLEDIKAFIENKGNKARLVGCWKAYTNVEYARMTFQKYKKCTTIYEQCFAEGFDIIKLTVAC